MKVRCEKSITIDWMKIDLCLCFYNNYTLLIKEYSGKSLFISQSMLMEKGHLYLNWAEILLFFLTSLCVIYIFFTLIWILINICQNFNIILGLSYSTNSWKCPVITRNCNILRKKRKRIYCLRNRKFYNIDNSKIHLNVSTIFVLDIVYFNIPNC